MENRLISMKDESESVGNLKRKTKKNMESITHFDLLNSPNYESDHHSRLNYLNNYRTDCCFILCRNFKLLQEEIQSYDVKRSEAGSLTPHRKGSARVRTHNLSHCANEKRVGLK